MRTFLIAIASTLTACGGSLTAKKCSTDADCTSDAFCAEGICRAVITVTIRSPAGGGGTAYTNGSVDFQIDVGGEAPDKLELLSDGTPVANLKAPYAYKWDTTSLAEGARTVTARATIGSKAFSSAALTLVVDRTPPAVISRAPTPGDGNVWVRAPITVAFSEPVNAATVNDSSVMLTGSGGVALGKTLSLSPDGKTLAITLKSTPVLPNTSSVTLTSAITDPAGNPLSFPSDAWTFTMPSWWHPWPVPLSSTMWDFRVAMAVDAEDNPVAAWSESTGSSRAAAVKRWNGSSWSELGAVRLAADVIDTPSLQVDPDGTPILAWEETNSGLPAQRSVYVAKWSGSAWTSLWGAPLDPAQAVFTTTSYTRTEPSLVLDSGGNPIVAATVVVGTIQSILVKKWNATTGAWSQLGGVLNVDNARHAYNHAITVGLDGNPVAAWVENTPWTGGGPVSMLGTGDVFVSAWNGADWFRLGTTALNASGRRAWDVTLGTDRHSQPFLAWTDFVPGANPADCTLNVARWGRVSWQSYGIVNDLTNSPPGEASLAVYASSPVIAWAESGIKVKSYSNGPWTMIGTTIGDAGTVSGGATVVATSGGTPIVAYAEGSSPGQRRAMLNVLNR